MFRPTPPQSARARFAALRAVPELASCSDRKIWSLLRYADEVCVPTGEQVPSGEFVVLIDGTLRAGTQLLGPGTSYGWDAMWDRSTNRTSVTVEADARLLVMSHAQFRAVKALVNSPPRQHNEPGLGAVA
jgi:hypothetical protein